MPKISLFRGVSPKNPTHIDLEEFLEDVRDGKWEDDFYKVRKCETKEQKEEVKDTLDRVTFSGTFSYRANKDIINHSGYIAMDIDDLNERLETVKKKLIEDRYSYSVYTSISGNSLRAIYKIKPEKHNDAFRGLCAHILAITGEICDSNGISPSKPYIVSYDPKCYINMEEYPEFKDYIKETPIKIIENFVHSDGDFEEVLANVVNRNVSICEGYDDWLKIGFAFAEQFGENGRSYFHKVSACSSKYKPRNVQKQYDYCLKSEKKGISISSFYYLAKINGVKIVSEQTRQVVRSVKNSKRAGLSKEQIIENLSKFQSIDGADKLVEQVLNNEDNFKDDEDSSVLEQVELYISNNYSLRMNEVTGFIENNGIRISEIQMNSIFIAAKKMVPKLDYQLMTRLLKSDFLECYNPFYEFLDSDGIAVHLPADNDPKNNEKFSTPLIDRLAKTVENDNPAFTRYFIRKWFVSMISAMHKVHSPLLLCLLGTRQGTGKTEWFRRLLPKELHDYYAESKLDREKDDEIAMTENILIVDDELGGKSKQDTLKLKDITSKQWFTVRRPYATANEKILRLALLGGTSNFLEIMSDPTGNRRIIPVEVDGIKKELYNSIDKKQLMLEAFRVYKEGFDWRINESDLELLNQDKSKYEMLNIEAELLLKYFGPTTSAKLSLSVSEIKVEIEFLTNQRMGLVKLGQELTKWKFIPDIREHPRKKFYVKRTGRPDSETKDEIFSKKRESDYMKEVRERTEQEEMNKKSQETEDINQLKEPIDDLPF